MTATKTDKCDKTRSCATPTETESLSATSECCETNQVSCAAEKEICENAIREKAYYLWEEAGRPEGDGSSFWYSARQYLAEQD